MPKYSVTYAGLVVMLLTQLFAWLQIEVASEEITQLAEVLIFLVGFVLAVWGRFRKGGVTLIGVKKENP